MRITLLSVMRFQRTGPHPSHTHGERFFLWFCDPLRAQIRKLVEMFNKGLENIKASGRYDEILNTYIAKIGLPENPLAGAVGAGS